MQIQNNLTRAAELNTEIIKIDSRISYLESLAKIIINKGHTAVELMIEPLPLNGANPQFYPIFERPEHGMGIFDYLTPNTSPKQIGFQRFYNAKDIANEEITSVAILLESDITLAVIDKIIIRLKQRKELILKESKKIIKAG